jgi:IS1 family transposase
VSQVLTALAAGLDQRAASRVCGPGGHTLARWLSRSGAHAERLQARHVRGLHRPHLQLDERRTRLRDQAHVRWRWLAVDPLTTAIPARHLGPRHPAAAHALVHALVQTLASGGVPAFTSDGRTLYFYALTAHVGPWRAGVGRRARQGQVAPSLLSGQVTQVERRRRLTRVVPCRRGGSWRAFRATRRGLGLSGRVTTAFIERATLTLRRGVAGLARRTWRTWSGGAPPTILLAHTAACGCRWPSRSTGVVAGARSAHGGGRRPWRSASPTTAGRCWSCCRIRYRRHGRRAPNGRTRPIERSAHGCCSHARPGTASPDPMIPTLMRPRGNEDFIPRRWRQYRQR